jgi:hypothetical protein
VPIHHRLATEEDLAKLPALTIGFGPCLTADAILAAPDKNKEPEEDDDD